MVPGSNRTAKAVDSPAYQGSESSGSFPVPLHLVDEKLGAAVELPNMELEHAGLGGPD